MNLQQLRYVREAVRRDLNLTEAAQALNTSQSGVSKQIRELEIELGVEIFVRRGKRITGLTRVGEGVVDLVERILMEAENLKRYAGDFSGERHGRLVIATTHNQARYVLPDVVSRFVTQYPDVALEIRQGAPVQAALAVLRGEADIAVATEALDAQTDLVTFPCFSWRHVAVVPQGHELARLGVADIKKLARYPLVTYGAEFSGRSRIDAAFRAAGLDPDIRLAAIDADVIKLYVSRGLGVGVIAEMAFTDADQMAGLTVAPKSAGLFQPSITKVAALRGALLHGYAYRFIELLAPHLTPDRVRETGLARVSLRAPKGMAAVIPEYADLTKTGAKVS
jgi:LysR family transcriptional regulator, cys regulon transcriptional activator